VQRACLQLLDAGCQPGIAHVPAQQVAALRVRDSCWRWQRRLRCYQHTCLAAALLVCRGLEVPVMQGWKQSVLYTVVCKADGPCHPVR
jgi:hypothetical protein